jgi:hypothetical protein
MVMPKPSALSTLFKLISCGTLLFLAAVCPAAGQTSEPQKHETEDVLPQFHFSAGGPSGLKVEQRSRETGIPPSFWKGAKSAAAPRLQINFPVKQQTQPLVRVPPPAPKVSKFLPPIRVPALNASNPLSSPPVQTADAKIPRMPNALQPLSPRQQDLCSVPLLRVPHAPSEAFSIGRVPAPRMDQAMAVKPSVPSCDEKTSPH